MEFLRQCFLLSGWVTRATLMPGDTLLWRLTATVNHGLCQVAFVSCSSQTQWFLCLSPLPLCTVPPPFFSVFRASSPSCPIVPALPLLSHVSFHLLFWAHVSGSSFIIEVTLFCIHFHFVLYLTLDVSGHLILIFYHFYLYLLTGFAMSSSVCVFPSSKFISSCRHYFYHHQMPVLWHWPNSQPYSLASSIWDFYVASLSINHGLLFPCFWCIFWEVSCKSSLFSPKLPNLGDLVLCPLRKTGNLLSSLFILSLRPPFPLFPLNIFHSVPPPSIQEPALLSLLVLSDLLKTLSLCTSLHVCVCVCVCVRAYACLGRKEWLFPHVGR